jgi:hypothetical protein
VIACTMQNKMWTYFVDVLLFFLRRLSSDCRPTTNPSTTTNTANYLPIMANTEGPSDEAMSSMLAMSSDEEKIQRMAIRPHQISGRANLHPPSFPRRSLARRELMMDLGEGESPAAVVIRSSTAPKVRVSSSTKKVDIKADNVEKAESDDEGGNDEHPEMRELSQKHVENPNHQRVILSEYIRERPMTNSNTISLNPSLSPIKPRESRFKQRNSNNIIGFGTPTSGGFPSLDIAPVGTLTRKGRQISGLKSTSFPGRMGIVNSTNFAVSNRSGPAAAAVVNDIGIAADSILSNMSTDEIRESVDEIKSMLSSQSIEFLKRRGRQKLVISMEQSAQQHITHDMLPNKQAISEQADLQLEEKKELDKKKKVSEVLSAVRTPEDLDQVYKEALQLGLATELPSSTVVTYGDPEIDEVGMNDRMKNLHTATSLLRSTAPRQKMLGAKCLMGILEEDVVELDFKRSRKTFSASNDERETMRQMYPKLLPVALRCLLDESIATYQTPSRSLLLSITLRCIHALMTLFVHPFHVICLNTKSNGWNDPFVLYQTCYLSDVSHIPPSNELYPPTRITPLEIAGVSDSACYKADSSAASASSDSKEFYLDPAWTLLSKMQMLPCLSAVISCLSVDHQKRLAIPDASIRSVCGILTMMTVRSPGAASAIARHKSILPFLTSYCLSPSDVSISKDSDDGANLIIPALLLLCHLARQSKDIAKLEMPFLAIMPFLQAVLCAESDSEVRSWSFILLRILMRYGIATEQLQSLIHIAAPRIEIMRSESSSIAHCLTFFAAVCDISQTIQLNRDGHKFPTSDSDSILAMTGVWLSSSVRNCFADFLDTVKCSGVNHMKLAAAQLRLMSSYISTSMPTMGAHSVPIVSKENCFEVINAVIESEMLDTALSTALAMSFNASWQNCTSSHAQSVAGEAIGCSFISAFMNFVKTVGLVDMDNGMRTALTNKIMHSMERSDGRNMSLSTNGMFAIHPARQAWFVESEFAVLSVLCGGRFGSGDSCPLLSRFAFSLLGRMKVGHESMAEFVFGQHKLFDVKNKSDCQSLQMLFRTELAAGDRVLQLDHSLDLFFMRDLCNGVTDVESLRCFATFVGHSNSDVGEGRFFLPLGGIWLWNVLSSSVTCEGGPACANDASSAVLDLVSHSLRLLLQLELVSNESFYVRSIETGTKLYHLASVCLLSESILSDGDVCVAIDSMFKRYTGFECSTVSNNSLVSEFIKACFEHSRKSKESKDKDVDAEKLYELLINEKPAREGFSKDQLKALDDFVDDLCNAYIEYGGQYATFTNFVRLFLRHDFPAKVISAVLTKLHPILHVFTIEEEDTNTLQFYLAQSISGALPSLDSSRRDPSSVLDSYSSALKKTNKVLLRDDFLYLLAIAVLSRNLASSSQRCDCGLLAMKTRLTGVSDEAFYDIIQVSEKILLIGAGTKTQLITCLMDVCMDCKKWLMVQDENTRKKWMWNANRENVWTRVVAALKASKKAE